SDVAVALRGPRASEVVRGAFRLDVAELPECGHARAEAAGQDVRIVRVRDAGVDGFVVWAESRAAAAAVAGAVGAAGGGAARRGRLGARGSRLRREDARSRGAVAGACDLLPKGLLPRAGGGRARRGARARELARPPPRRGRDERARQRLVGPQGWRRGGPH